jgi:hypothetical protein
MLTELWSLRIYGGKIVRIRHRVARMNSTVVQGKVVLSENCLLTHSILWAGQSCVSYYAFQSIHLLRLTVKCRYQVSGRSLDAFGIATKLSL